MVNEICIKLKISVKDYYHIMKILNRGNKYEYGIKKRVTFDNIIDFLQGLFDSSLKDVRKCEII